MKKCDYFKDLILTDYIDGQLDKSKTQNLEEHLQVCVNCQIYLREVKRNSVLPLNQSILQPVPIELWQKITEGIEQQAKPVGSWSDFLEGLKGWMVLPRLVPVLASLVVVLIVGTVSFNTLQLRQAQDIEQGQYLATVIGSTNPAASAETNDLGTPMETYFL